MNQVDPLSFKSAAAGDVAPGRWHQILNALPDPVVLFNPAGQIDFANVAARKAFAASAGESCCHPTHGGSASLGCPLETVLATQAAVIVERVTQREDGKMHYVQITVTPLRDALGQIDGLLETHHDITQQRQEAQRLQLLQGHLLELAHRDALTNLANRRYLEMKLERLAADGSPRQCALLFADLDHFKPVNDVHGHITGDAVLTTIASRLRQVLRGTDLLARIGGDEFAILLEGATESGARAVAGKIIAALAEPVASLPEPNLLGVSIGICLFKTGAEMPATLLMQADQAMYRAKRRGGNQFDLLML